MIRRIIELLITGVIVSGLCACTPTLLDSSDTEIFRDPTWQEQYDLGIRYLSEGNYEEAIIAFTAAIEIDPKQAPAYVGRGDAYVLSGETEENLAAAKADYEAAIELDGTLADAWLGLADVYIRRGDYDRALEILRESLEKTGNNQAIADKIAEIEAGNISDSSGNIRRMNSYNGNGELVWYHIYDYNEFGQESSVTVYDAEGNQTDYFESAYDGEGRVLLSYGYRGDTGEITDYYEYEYDSMGNIVKKQQYNLGERYGLTDRLGLYTLFQYDSSGKLISSEEYDSE